MSPDHQQYYCKLNLLWHSVHFNEAELVLERHVFMRAMKLAFDVNEVAM